MSVRRSCALALLLLAGCLLLAPASASALTYEFLESFGSVAQPSFSKAEGMAVDQSTGDLLVIDAEAKTIRRFKPNGEPDNFSALSSTNVIDGKTGEADATPQNGLSFGSPFEVQVAVDNSSGATDGNIYVTDEPHHLIDIFAEDGSFLGQLSASSEGAFGAPCGVAVDPEGNIYVGDYPSKVHKFSAAGTNTLNFAATNPCTLAAGASPSAGFVFVSSYAGAVRKFGGSTGEAKYTVSSGENTTVTVDPATGFVYVAKGATVLVFDASGASEGELQLLTTITVASNVTGIAVEETTSDLFIARSGSSQIEVWEAISTPEAITEAPTPVGATTATLRGEVNPKGLPLEECFFEWGVDKSYGEVAPCEEPDAEDVGEGTAPVPVHADIEGLDEGTSYHFRLVATNANGSAEGFDREFTTLGPGIREEEASQISASGARITGEVNPNGNATSFVVQYVTQAKFEATEYAKASTVPSSPKAVGSGTAFALVTLQLTGLAPDTTYHFRIVATNSAATNQGEDHSFTTFAEAPASLPDGRAYEMVSPPQKSGEVFPPNPLGELGSSCTSECLPGSFLPMAPMQARPDGEAVVYEGQPFEAGQASGTNEYLAGRSPEGWQSQDLSSPLSQYEEEQGYRAFSDDLSRAVIYQIEPALSPEAPSSEGKSFANLYLRQEGALEPLVATEPPQRTPGQRPFETRFELAYGGANAGTPLIPAFSHIVFAANDALTEASAFAPKAPAIEAGQGCVFFGDDCNLYEWVEGELRLVNVLPETESKVAAHHAVIGSRLSDKEPPASDHAISDDGSRIFWSDETGQVFVRIDGEETREIDASGRFLDASSDGAKALLGSGCLYDLQTEACEDLTAGKGGFQGILGAAEDLSQIYFVDEAALAGGAEARVCAAANTPKGKEEEAEGIAPPGRGCNLYGWQEGSIAFIGTLLGTNSGAWRPSSARRTAQVTPDGRYLTFMSQARLTGYDNNSRSEVFEYDAESGELVCVSCNPSGQRPIGPSNLSLMMLTVVTFAPAAPLPAPHNLAADGQGRIFFESQDALSPRDTNAGIQDVYEWEPNGVGSCERPSGCVYLISSGKDANDSMFFNSTPNGDDAFFVTRERLLPRDKDEKLDLYDARAPHGEPLDPETEISPCSGEACKGPIPNPPAQPTPGSVGFSGPGNPKPKPHCKKGFVRKHGKCVKKHKKHKQHKRAAKHHRGGAR